MAFWIRSYLNHAWRAMTAYLLAAFAINLVLGLSWPMRDAWAEIAYLDALLLALGAACWAYGFLHYRSRHRAIKAALDAPDAAVSPVLSVVPQAEDVRWTSECVRREAALAEVERLRLERELAAHGDHLARWAHDVKTPLAVCALVLDRAEAEPVRAPLQLELAKVRAQVGHVLHQERLSALNGSVKMEPLDLAQLCREAIGRAAPLLMARELEVERSGRGGAMGDGQCVSYILDQLLTNAAKYAPEGTCVRVRVGEGVVGVENDGPGVPEQDRRRVFDKGYTGERRAGGGSGMGLYYASETARALGGELALEGAARFVLRLPVRAEYLKPASM